MEQFELDWGTERESPDHIVESGTMVGDVGDGYAPVECAGSEVSRGMVREIFRIIEKAAGRYGAYDECFTRIVEVCEAAVVRDEARYLELVGKMKREEVMDAAAVMSHLLRMTLDCVVDDVLGRVYMEVSSRWKAAALGQYFTPPDLCTLIAEMTLGNNVLDQVIQARVEGRKIRVMDPAIGSGAMILGMKKVILRQAGFRGLRQFEFCGQDSDRVCVRMAKIQIHLTDFDYMRDRLFVAAGDVQGVI